LNGGGGGERQRTAQAEAEHRDLPVRSRVLAQVLDGAGWHLARESLRQGGPPSSAPWASLPPPTAVTAIAALACDLTGPSDWPRSPS